MESKVSHLREIDFCPVVSMSKEKHLLQLTLPAKAW
ncbi:hypothetical protein T05_1466 [Trichinella murrelli]|uniref:Uncharacterized protein n=1 Tax=Trichinella murrelli TaxID=144512 RepID=A0A0V0SVL5_9BILA|nr:hypothetical protein T05_1466 [Trichinella murrelli]